MTEIRDWTPDEIAEALKLAKESYTADDLKKFGEIGEMDGTTEMGGLLAELEKDQKEFEGRATCW